MKGLKAAGPVLLAWLTLAGCDPVPSLHPFHTEEAVTAAPDWLLGTWVADNGAFEGITLLTFTEDSFALSGHSDEALSHYGFKAVYFTAGTTLFVDVTFKSMFWQDFETSVHVDYDDNRLGGALVPTHMLLRPRRTGRRELELSYLADDWEGGFLERLGIEQLELAHGDFAVAPPEWWMEALESGRVPADSFDEFFGEFHRR